MEKFALVDFFERSEIEIVETKYIYTQCKNELNREEWNVDEEVEVPWPINVNQNNKMGKNQVKKYVAKILRFGATVAELTPYCKAAENGKEVPFHDQLVYGRGKRGKQPKRQWDSESEDESSDGITSRQQNRVKKLARKSVFEEAREKLRAKTLSSKENEEIHDLREEVSKLEKENLCLRRTLTVIDGLPDILKKMKELSEKAETQPAMCKKPETQPTMCKKPETQPTSSNSLAQSHRSECQESERQVITDYPQPNTTRRIFGYEINEKGQVDLGHGIIVNGANLQFVTRANPQKTCYGICEVVCTREEMASTSVTGKQSNAFKEVTVKEKLSPSKVSAITDFVQKVHPGTDTNNIKKMISVKLNIVQKLMKRKSLGSVCLP